MSMQNNASPGNGGLTKDFFIKCRTAKLNEELSTWQRQAVIKLI